MSDIRNEIKTTDIEWEMHWGENHKDKPPTEMIFEEEGALAHLLLNEVVFLNSLWWEKECPERVRNLISVNVNCNDIFAWGCADAEGLPHEEIENLYRMWKADTRWGAAKWCMIRRNEKPQPPVIKAMKTDGSWNDSFDKLGENWEDNALQELIKQTFGKAKLI